MVVLIEQKTDERCEIQYCEYSTQAKNYPSHWRWINQMIIEDVVDVPDSVEYLKNEKGIVGVFSNQIVDEVVEHSLDGKFILKCTVGTWHSVIGENIIFREERRDKEVYYVHKNQA